jgi:hypothetical protein
MKTKTRLTSLVCAALMGWSVAGCSPAAKNEPSGPAKTEPAKQTEAAKPAANASFATTSTSTPAAASPAKAEGWGTLKGKFVFDGTPPEPAKINIMGKDPAVCGVVPLFDETLLVGPDGGIANVIVYLTTKNPSVHPDYAKTANDKVELDNKGCMFVPHVVPVLLSQTFVVKNSDPVGHNVNIQPPLDEPRNIMLSPGDKVEFQFKRSQRLPVNPSCNIHTWMSCYVLPRDNPYTGVSGLDGSFEIKNLPAGELEFVVWKEKIGYLAAKPEWTKGVIKMTIQPGDNDLGTIKVGPDLLKPKS